MAEETFSLFKWRKSEISFVVVVLATIFGISFFQLKESEMKTRDAQRKSDVDLIVRSLESYYGDHQEYPAASPDGLIVSCGGLADQPCAWGEGPVRDIEGVTYLKQIPRDPFFDLGWEYVYELDGESQKYKVYAALERSSDDAYKGNLTIQCGAHVQCNWYEGN